MPSTRSVESRRGSDSRADTKTMSAPSPNFQRQQRTEELIFMRMDLEERISSIALKSLNSIQRSAALQLHTDIEHLDAQIVEALARLREERDDGPVAAVVGRDPLSQAKEELSSMKGEYASLVELGLERIDIASSNRIKSLRRQIDAINDELVKLHRLLVLSYTGQFRSHNDPFASEDFNAAGMLGLMKAINNYDPRYGATFASWAYQPIKREVLGAVRDHEYQNLSRGDFEQRNPIRKAIKELRQVNPHTEPTDDEIAELTGCRIAQVQRIRNAMSPISLQAQLSTSDDSGSEIGDFLKDETQDIEGAVITAMSLEALQRYGLACLNHRELFVLVRRFGLDGEPREKLQQIGRSLGISREAARQIEAKAKAKLNHPLVLQHLTPSGSRLPAEV